jgi:hypothetical protein
LLIWESIWGEECHWCPHIYKIYVFDWDGQRYNFERQYDTKDKYDPSLIVGRAMTMFGLTADLGRHLRIESSHTEFDRLKEAGNVSPEFVNGLLQDSYSFWRSSIMRVSLQI